MSRLALLLATLLGVTACAAVYDGPASSPYTETGAICDNAGLESQLVALKDQSRRTRGALAVGTPSGGGVVGAGRGTRDLQRVYQLRDKLNRFDAEVDAQFRTMTSACKAYSRCMEMREYEVNDCGPLLTRWTTAESTFAAMSTTLRQIDAEIAKVEIASRRPVQVPNPQQQQQRVNPNDPNCRCTGNVGGIFSTCCPN